MRIRHLVALAAAAGLAGGASAAQAPVSIAVQPIVQREGVVVSWRDQSATAVVALPSGRMLAVHSLRRVTPGTRVRVDGIKWGTPTSGIKWSAPRTGIKWGIKWSRNGSYQSNLRELGVQRTASLRGRVVKRHRGGVVIGVRGGVVGVRMAVWLPRTTKSVNGRLPAVGEDLLVRVRIGPRGRLHGISARIVGNGRNVVPLVGELSVVSSTDRKVRISSAPDPAYRLEATLAVPTSIDIAALPVGREVAATAKVSADGSMTVASISPNESFAAGNDPAAQIVAGVPADAQTLELLLRTRTRWDAGRTAGEITDEATYVRGRDTLSRADTFAREGNLVAAAAEVDAFIASVTPDVPAKIAPALAADVLALADVVYVRLTE